MEESKPVEQKECRCSDQDYNVKTSGSSVCAYILPWLTPLEMMGHYEVFLEIPKGEVVQQKYLHNDSEDLQFPEE